MPKSEIFKCRCSFSLTDSGTYYSVSLCVEHLGRHQHQLPHHFRLEALMAQIHAEVVAVNDEPPRVLSHTDRPDMFDVLTRKPSA